MFDQRPSTRSKTESRGDELHLACSSALSPGHSLIALPRPLTYGSVLPLRLSRIRQYDTCAIRGWQRRNPARYFGQFHSSNEFSGAGRSGDALKHLDVVHIGKADTEKVEQRIRIRPAIINYLSDTAALQKFLQATLVERASTEHLVSVELCQHIDVCIKLCHMHVCIVYVGPPQYRQ